MKITPTTQFYGLAQRAFDHFNENLFEGVLSPCLITTQREKNVMGFFSPERWVNGQGAHAHEISLNPAYFANHSVIEVLQTLVHEQCHLWQHEHGKPSRAGYHNREWADRMETIGLIPSSTGEPGGKRIGQKMSDYPAPTGAFMKACENLIDQGFEVPWVDRYPASNDSCQLRGKATSTKPEPGSTREILVSPITELLPDLATSIQETHSTSAKKKARYHCPSCGINVWGKPNLNIGCNDCSVPLVSS